MKYKLTTIILLSFIFIVIILGGFEIRKKYNIYQEDYIYIYNNIRDRYAFRHAKDKKIFEDKKEKILKRLEYCDNEIDFVNIVNNELWRILKSPHTGVCDKEWSNYIITTYKDVYEKDNRNKMFEKIYKYSKTKLYKTKYNKSKIHNSSYIYKGNVHSFDIISNKVKYIKIDSFIQQNIYYDKQYIKNIIEMTKAYPILIIDIRNNSGGSTDYPFGIVLPRLIKNDISFDITALKRKCMTFDGYIKMDSRKDYIMDNLKGDTGIVDMYQYYKDISYEVKRAEDSIDYAGKIYLLINENTGSSAGEFAAFMKYKKIATLIGSTTSSEILGEDPAIFILPKTNLILRIEDQLPIIYNKSVQDTHKIRPDIYVNNKNDVDNKWILTNILEDNVILRVLIEEGYDVNE